MKLNSLINRIKDETVKRSPEILVAAGIASMISATVFAIQDTPKVTKLLKDKEETKKAPLETEEKVKIIVPGYLRTIVASGIGVACIVGASSIRLHRNAVLTAAYTMSETALKNYTKKAEEIVGKEKADEIREKAQADAQLAVPQPVKAKSNDVIIIDDDCIKCYDSLTGRYFPSNKNLIEKAVNEMNRLMRDECFMSENDWFNMIGLDSVLLGDDLGWSIDTGYLDISYSSRLDEKGNPALVIGYVQLPRPLHSY